MTAWNRPARGSSGTGLNESAAAKPPKLNAECSDATDNPALFDTVVDCHAYGRTTTLVPSQYVTGPGPRPAVTVGPRDAQAPDWWWREAEAAVLELLEANGTVTSDDLHERYPDDPSASGAAIGGLFARMAHAGRIAEVGMVKSRRPEARRRRILVWGLPS